MTRRLLEIAAEIVKTQASISPLSSEQIESALIKTFVTLQKMQKAEDEGTLMELEVVSQEAPVQEIATEKIDPRQSIQEDRVICLECGAAMKQLTGKHLSFHGLTVRDYRKKWGFPLRQSLSANALSRARSKAAKKRGLPENLLKYQAEKKRKRLESSSFEASSILAGSEAARETKRRPRKKQAE